MHGSCFYFPVLMNRRQSTSRQSVLSCFAAVLTMICATALQAQVAPAAGLALENFDIRDTKASAKEGATAAAAQSRQLTAERAAAVQTVVDAMGPARANLARRVPALQLEQNRFGHAPEIVGVTGAGAFLTPVPSGDTPRETVARDFLVENAEIGRAHV
jgi:hypothetical protein